MPCTDYRRTLISAIVQWDDVSVAKSWERGENVAKREAEEDAMTWYAAHLVECLRLDSGKQDAFPVLDNIVLVRASDPDEAYAKAEALGKQRESDSPWLWHGEKRARGLRRGTQGDRVSE